MPRAGVLGSPIAHSLSPALHRAAYSALGLTGWTYDAIECTEQELAGLLAGIDPDWVGLSLTMPLKRAVLALVDTVSDLARDVGAANTVVFSGARADRASHADNTDVGGMVDVLLGADVSVPVIMGSGGSAAAALAALRESGAAQASVVVRDVGRAADLLAAAGRLDIRVTLRPWPEISPSATVVISTVPAWAAVGAVEPILHDDLTVFDVRYHPRPSPLLQAAAGAGARTITGFDLLLHQAARQVELMTGRPAPIAAMKAVLP
ncbi:MAG: shikimate dehydrogenase [Mycobacteriales bacterium]